MRPLHHKLTQPGHQGESISLIVVVMAPHSPLSRIQLCAPLTQRRRAAQDKAEAKLASLEAKSEAQRRERAAAEAEWREQQRDRDIWRAQQDAEREKEVRNPQP